MGLLLSGCGYGSLDQTLSPNATTTQLSGQVHGGRQPIVGATVNLWETGVDTTATATANLSGGSVTSYTVTNMGSGYGTTPPTVTISGGGGMNATATAVLTNGKVTSITKGSGGSGYTSAPTVTLSVPSAYGVGAATLKASTTTNASGYFDFGSASVSCSGGGPFSYITAASGDGIGSGTNNTAIMLVAVMGACANVGQTFVSINEVTTVAAAYALGNFTVDSTTSSSPGTASATVTAGSVSIGNPVSNSQGLADAIVNTALLVNTSNGFANPSTATVLLPSATLYTVADALAACVNTTGPGQNGCISLMAAATPPITGGVVPADTFQAAMNIAKYPGNQINAIFNLVAAVSPYQPALTGGTASAPLNDLSMAVAYLNPTLAAAKVAPAYITIDASDNIWTVGAATDPATGYNYITETTSASAGATTTNTLGTTAALAGTHGIKTAAFDSLGDLWMSDASQLGTIQIPSGSTPAAATEYSYAAAASPNYNTPSTFAIAIDASNNVFTASYGAPGSCHDTTYTSGNLVCEVLELQSGSSYAATNLYRSTTASKQYSVRSMAVDTNTATGYTGYSSTFKGNLWSAFYGSTSGVGSVVGLLKTTGLSSITVPGTSPAPYGVALDATSTAWVTANGTSVLYSIPPTATGSTTPTAAAAYETSTINNANSTSPASTATTPLAIGGLSGPKYLAIDGAGNIFVANSNASTVVEYAPGFKDGTGNSGGFLSPFYGFSPSLTVAASTVAITGYTVASNVITVSAVNSLTPGQTVTLSGFAASSAALNGVTLTVLSTGLTGSAFTASYTAANTTKADAGTGTIAAYNQVQFTCVTATTTTCSPINSPYAGNASIAIDRAGTVWSLNTNGTLVGIIGTAAPTNPVLAAGAYGVLP